MKSAFHGESTELDCPPTFDTFIFDLDGTLLDTMPDLVVLTNSVLQARDFPERTPAEILSFVGNGVEALIRQALPKGESDDEVHSAMVCWKDLFPQQGLQLTKRYPSVAETLTELKNRGVKLGVLSNKFDEGAQEAVQTFFPELFGAVHGESALVPRKPNPTGLLLTIQELAADVRNSVFVGDSPSDMVVAQNAGMYALGVSWGYHPTESLYGSGANAVITQASDLLRFAPKARHV